MGFFNSLLGIGGSATQKTQVLPGYDTAAFDQMQGKNMQAIQAYGDASSEYLSSGMESYMPSTFADLGEPTETALYSALSPQGLSNSDLKSYVSQLDQGMFETELTSPQSMADRARAASLFDGL